MNRMLTLVALLVSFLSLGRAALAGTSGGIAGVVTDARSGAPVAGVQVQITSPSQSVTTTTDSKGHYIVFSLQPDDYTITLEKPGYSSRSVGGNSVYADQTQRYDLQINPAPPGQ